MTTYTAIAGTEIDADSPITDALLQKMRDNPIAITEGAPGAPRVKAAALSTFSNTITGSLTSGSNTDVTIGGFAFFPACSGSATFTLGGTGTGPDDAKINVFNPSGSSQAYTIYWRAMV